MNRLTFGRRAFLFAVVPSAFAGLNSQVKEDSHFVRSVVLYFFKTKFYQRFVRRNLKTKI